MGIHWIERAFPRTTIDSNGCWRCSYDITANGYSRIWTGEKSVRIHRISYEHFRGEIPEGLMVCHKCDVRNCWNPEHLFLGTAQDNIADMVAKGRHSSGATGVPGERNGSAVLTREKVSEIRKRAANGEMRKDLAIEFGVCLSHICRLVKGDYWGDA